LTKFTPGLKAEKNNRLQSLIRSLPSGPGVYRYLDENGKVIYVGKAKNLKKRVSSYFTKKHTSGKLRLLVKKITDIEFVVTETERDALFLENNLIKKYQPRYNVQLKDDKSYPWIVIKNEHFPRVFYTRELVKDGSEYFGPYTSSQALRQTLKIIFSVFRLRSCSDRSMKNRSRPCLKFQIRRCSGPCTGEISSLENSLKEVGLEVLVAENPNLSKQYLQ